MTSLSVSLIGNRLVYAPGETLEGEAAWKLDKSSKKIFLRLFWFTRGKGTEDIEVVSETVFERPMTEETRPFKIQLPAGPYSFSGRLVSLVWSLELAPAGHELAETCEITISPFGYEIDLTKDG